MWLPSILGGPGSRLLMCCPTHWEGGLPLRRCHLCNPEGQHDPCAPQGPGPQVRKDAQEASPTWAVLGARRPVFRLGIVTRTGSAVAWPET